MNAGTDVKPQGADFFAKVGGIGFKFVAQRRCFGEHVNDSNRRPNDNWRQGIGKQVGPGALAE